MKWVMGKKGLLCVDLLVGLLLVNLNYDSGYGPVSSQSYQFSKAIYGACQNKNEGRLQKVCELMEGPQGADLPAHERRWLEGMVAQANAGDWDLAAKNARRMMEDQVRY